MTYRLAAMAALLMLSCAVNAQVSVNGNTISWADNGDYYQVQNQSTFQSVCEGVYRCTVEDGIYQVTNLTKISRVRDIVVPQPVPVPAFDIKQQVSGKIIVSDDFIILPDDDNSYRVKEQGGEFRIICEGETSCQVEPGVYQVINTTTGEVTRDIAVERVEPVTGNPGGVSNRVFVNKDSIWLRDDIAVCWENPSPEDRDQRIWTRDAVETTWEKEGRLDFTGWDACTADSMGIRILISDSTPNVLVLGRGLDGLRNGMTLNFNFRAWGPVCANGGAEPAGYERPDRIRSNSEEEFCLKTIAVHEFGHAVGMAHEHNRDDRAVCDNEPQGTNGDWLVTKYDLESIMNYCSTFWNASGKLSELDKEGYRILYGNTGGDMSSAMSQANSTNTTLYGTLKFGSVVSLEQIPTALSGTVPTESSIWLPTIIGNSFEDNVRIVGEVVAVPGPDGQNEIFGLDEFGELLRITDDNGFYTWENVGNGFDFGTRFAGDITAFASVEMVNKEIKLPTRTVSFPRAVPRIDIFGLDTRGHVLHAWLKEDKWNWEDLGNGFSEKNFQNSYDNTPFTGPIQAVSSGAGSMHIIGFDRSGNVSQLSWNGTRWLWEKFNSFYRMREAFKDLQPPFALTSSAPGRLDFFALNHDSTVRHVAFDKLQRASTSNLGMEGNGRIIFRSMSATSPENSNKLSVFGMDKKGKILKLERLSAGAWSWSTLGKQF